jgi:REP element-mobilizing transposase RayT
MNFIPQHVYHIYNQGNDRQRIFHSDGDYQSFLNYTVKLLLPYCDMIAYTLMPNHFHFQLNTKLSCGNLIRQGGLNLDPLTNGVRKLLSSYTRIYNIRYNRLGSLFRQKTKAKCLTEQNALVKTYSQFDYCSTCFYYIHSNAVTAGLVLKPEDWKWSSYAYYAGLTNNGFCNKSLASQYCGYKEEDFKHITPSDTFLLQSILEKSKKNH